MEITVEMALRLCLGTVDLQALWRIGCNSTGTQPHRPGVVIG